MNTLQGWQQYVLQYVNQLEQKLNEQEQKMKQMEQTIEGLVFQISELQSRESTHIEKIEYKFDQLKVETVEGTLHIGVLPGKSEVQNDIIPKGQGFEGGPYDLQFSSQVQSALFDRAKQRIDRYLQHEMPVYIHRLQEQYAFVLGEEYIHQMIRDLGAQTDGRILYYLNQMNLPQDEKAAEDEVVRRTTRDIETALKQHFDNKKNEERD